MIAHSQRRKVILLAGFVTFVAFNLSHAQVPPPVTSSGLNTLVSGPIAVGGETQFNITGGTRPGGGGNLFHSFGNFNVPTNNIANFLNETGLPTSNILARVTGTNGNNPTLSSIYGTIQTTGFEGANLFLMNPAGFLFGPNATVNVGGMVAFTSADYLRLADNARFNAIPNAAADALLIASPVTAFGFLGSNPRAITVQGSQFTVTEGTGISLVGGNIAIQSGTPDGGTTQPARLVAPGGQINLASVASPGEVSAVDFMPTSGITPGNISLSQGALLDVSANVDVSANAAGTVRIRGGQLVMDNATISANTGENNGAPIAVDIDVTGDLSISSNQNSAITARATGAGNAGEIRINSGNLDVDLAFPEFGVVIDSSTVGSGNAGKVTVTTGDLTAANNSPTGFSYFIDSGTGGGGDFRGANINTGDAIFLGTGSAGNLYIGGTNSKADSLHFEANLTTEAFNSKGGSITLEGRDIQIKNFIFVSSMSLLGENPITINADQLTMDTVVRVQAQTIGTGNGGDIVFTGKRLEMSNESAFITNTFSDGNAGNIRVNASEYVRLADNPLVPTPSGLFTNSFGSPGVTTNGKAGAIEVITPRLDMTGGARLSTTTQTAGRGGDVTVTASEGVFISGQRTGGPLENFGLGGSDGSGIFTRTIGTEQCGAVCGRGGDQVITTGHLILQKGGILDSGTTGNGNGGNIVVKASNDIVLSGTLIDGTPSGIFSRTIGSEPDAGAGGNIALTAEQSVTISDGASVSSSSTGPGNTGNIQINAGQSFVATNSNSAVTTEADAASGGTIKITTSPSGTVQLTDSTISASVLDGTGGGGSVDIDPLYVILLNSQILANAVEGPGGNISINISNGGLFLPDATSTVSASSQFGVNGTVTIQSPNAPASGKIQPLGKTPLQATSLLNQHCASLAGGEFSSFTVAGRDSLPTEPGSWLASPLYAAGVGEGQGVRGEGLEGETALLSLRQIAPTGFLTQAFALDWSTGCQS
jgi:filamentous hemagglutinin family protein